MPTRKRTNQSLKPPVVTGGAINVALPDDADRMRVLQTLAEAIIEVARSIGPPSMVYVSDCTVHANEKGTCGIYIGDRNRK